MPKNLDRKYKNGIQFTVEKEMYKDGPGYLVRINIPKKHKKKFDLYSGHSSGEYAMIGAKTDKEFNKKLTKMIRNHKLHLKNPKGYSEDIPWK